MSKVDSGVYLKLVFQVYFVDTTKDCATVSSLPFILLNRFSLAPVTSVYSFPARHTMGLVTADGSLKAEYLNVSPCLEG